MNIVIISALGNEAARKCINSLYATTPENRFDLFVVRERGFREQTLNQALKIVGKEKDVLFVGDDIQFTAGWFEALITHYEEADILGLSMLYPDTTKIQDRGYDLVDLDGRIILEPRDRGKTKESAAPFTWRACDALCGCFMLVKSEVFKLVPEFREE